MTLRDDALAAIDAYQTALDSDEATKADLAAQLVSTHQQIDALNAADAAEDAAYEKTIADLRAQLNGIVKTNECVDFAAPPPSGPAIPNEPFTSGFWLPNGVQGSGVGSAVYQMKAMTSTKAGKVSPLVKGQTNPYRLMKVGSTNAGSPAQSLEVGGFTLQGTDQGHPFGGLDILYAVDPRIHDLMIRGPIPGFASGPPGETFLLHTQRTVNPQFSDITLDGHDAAGKAVGGTLNGNSYLTNGGSWTRVKHYGAGAGFGTAIFQATGAFTWTDCEWVGNRQHINIEDSFDASYDLVRPVFRSLTGDPRFVAQISSKTSSARVTFTDPVVESWPLTVRWYPNGGTQKKADIRLVLGGKDVSADPTKLAFINF